MRRIQRFAADVVKASLYIVVTHMLRILSLSLLRGVKFAKRKQATPSARKPEAILIFEPLLLS